MIFGVPVHQQEEESFLTLSSISYFFDDSDQEELRTDKEHRNRPGLRRRKNRTRKHTKSKNLSLADSEEGVADSDSTSESKMIKRKRFSDSTGGLEQLQAGGKVKEKRNKTAGNGQSPDKIWNVANPPHILGLEYVNSNIYK